MEALIWFVFGSWILASLIAVAGWATLALRPASEQGLQRAVVTSRTRHG